MPPTRVLRKVSDDGIRSAVAPVLPGTVACAEMLKRERSNIDATGLDRLFVRARTRFASIGDCRRRESPSGRIPYCEIGVNRRPSRRRFSRSSKTTKLTAVLTAREPDSTESGDSSPRASKTSFYPCGSSEILNEALQRRLAGQGR